MNRLLALLLLFSATLVLPAYAQDDQARDLFASYAATNAAKGRPGAKIRLELLRGERRQFVPLNTVFRMGDKVKLHFEVNFAAQVSIFNLGTSGKVSRLYPQQGRYASARAATNYVVPAAATEWFEFDDRPGTEKLNFVFSSATPQVKPARPATAPPNAKRPSEVVIVEPGGRELGEEASPAANEEALANGRDLNRVQLKDAYYALGTPQQLRQRVGILLDLQHR